MRPVAFCTFSSICSLVANVYLWPMYDTCVRACGTWISQNRTRTNIYLSIICVALFSNTLTSCDSSIKTDENVIFSVCLLFWFSRSHSSRLASACVWESDCESSASSLSCSRPFRLNKLVLSSHCFDKQNCSLCCRIVAERRSLSNQ